MRSLAALWTTILVGISAGWRPLRRGLVMGVLLLNLWATGLLSGEYLPTALAAIDDDRYDGNIFVVYAGNGSLVPPRLTLTESFQRQLPVVLIYYLDDSKDCKQFAFTVSRIQEFYGRAASIIPISIDSLPSQGQFSKTEPGYYYHSGVPQTVILDQNRQIVFDEVGNVPFETIDDTLREVFGLLPREESVELKLRSFNEFNSEFVPESQE